MKIYDKKEGKNFIEILPVNNEQLMCFRYGANKTPVRLSIQELSTVINFLTKIKDNMAILGTKVIDANTQTIT